jgi:hypothetical protein
MISFFIFICLFCPSWQPAVTNPDFFVFVLFCRSLTTHGHQPRLAFASRFLLVADCSVKRRELICPLLRETWPQCRSAGHRWNGTVDASLHQPHEPSGQSSELIHQCGASFTSNGAVCLGANSVPKAWGDTFWRGETAGEPQAR